MRASIDLQKQLYGMFEATNTSLQIWQTLELIRGEIRALYPKIDPILVERCQNLGAFLNQPPKFLSGSQICHKTPSGKTWIR